MYIYIDMFMYILYVCVYWYNINNMYCSILFQCASFWLGPNLRSRDRFRAMADPGPLHFIGEFKEGLSGMIDQ